MTHPETTHDTTSAAPHRDPENPMDETHAIGVKRQPGEARQPAAKPTQPSLAETNGHSHRSASTQEQILTSEQRSDLQERWERIQARFIDEPKGSVKEANELVSDVTDRIVDTFQTRRDDLEQTWKKGDDVSTETLRVTLKRYRSFFDRLLTV